MKSKIFYACLFAASVLTSCSDFLEEKPKGVLSGDVYFSAVQDFDLATNSLYEKINQTQSWTNPMYPQWQGDDMTANPASNKQAGLPSTPSVQMVVTRALPMPGTCTIT